MPTCPTKVCTPVVDSLTVNPLYTTITYLNISIDYNDMPYSFDLKPNVVNPSGLALNMGTFW